MVRFAGLVLVRGRRVSRLVVPVVGFVGVWSGRLRPLVVPMVGLVGVWGGGARSFVGCGCSRGGGVGGGRLRVCGAKVPARHEKGSQEGDEEERARGDTRA
jgi:hypothetical protein